MNSFFAEETAHGRRDWCLRRRVCHGSADGVQEDIGLWWWCPMTARAIGTAALAVGGGAVVLVRQLRRRAGPRGPVGQPNRGRGGGRSPSTGARTR